MSTQVDKQIVSSETGLNHTDKKGRECKMRKTILRYLLLAGILVFGLITVFLSASLLFDLFDVRERQGIFVPFIVIANLIAGILYLLAAWYFFKSKPLALKLLFSALMVLFVAFAILLIYIDLGGIYQSKTITAMMFRMALNLAFLLGAAYFIALKNQRKKRTNNIQDSK
jgi:hypothetical protein